MILSVSVPYETFCILNELKKIFHRHLVYNVMVYGNTANEKTHLIDSTLTPDVGYQIKTLNTKNICRTQKDSSKYTHKKENKAKQKQNQKIKCKSIE